MDVVAVGVIASAGTFNATGLNRVSDMIKMKGFESSVWVCGLNGYGFIRGFFLERVYERWW